MWQGLEERGSKTFSFSICGRGEKDLANFTVCTKLSWALKWLLKPSANGHTLQTQLFWSCTKFPDSPHSSNPLHSYSPPSLYWLPWCCVPKIRMVIPVAMVTYQPPVHKSIHLVQVHSIDNGVNIVQHKLNIVCTLCWKGGVYGWPASMFGVCAFVCCVWTSCMPPHPLFLCSLPSIEISLFSWCVCVCVCVCEKTKNSRWFLPITLLSMMFQDSSWSVAVINSRSHKFMTS